MEFTNAENTQTISKLFKEVLKLRIDVLKSEHLSFGSSGKALPLDKLTLDSLRIHNRSLENRLTQMKTEISKTPPPLDRKVDTKRSTKNSFASAYL